jgi:hypothetical protein
MKKTPIFNPDKTNVLITYDLFSNYRDTDTHEKIKKAMNDLDYMDRIIVDNIVHYLPNTTLWKEGATPGEAKAVLDNIAGLYDASVSRYFGCKLTQEFFVIEGVKYLDV